MIRRKRIRLGLTGPGDVAGGTEDWPKSRGSRTGSGSRSSDKDTFISTSLLDDEALFMATTRWKARSCIMI